MTPAERAQAAWDAWANFVIPDHLPEMHRAWYEDMRNELHAEAKRLSRILANAGQ